MISCFTAATYCVMCGQDWDGEEDERAEVDSGTIVGGNKKGQQGTLVSAAHGAHHHAAEQGYHVYDALMSFSQLIDQRMWQATPWSSMTT